MRKLLGFMVVACVAACTPKASVRRPVVVEDKDPEVGDLSCPGPGMSIHELLDRMAEGPSQEPTTCDAT